ncbi:MAG: DNA mismatch repair protein MutL [Desulfotomaculum sp. 46_296]|nr:MAG: DNA mismatch repair protein MutL [Desulfotomaculum sp. 46_296]HAU32092.1 DNA mismatch repair endonuclease MutL [Desulfotomaculum sp.]
MPKIVVLDEITANQIAAGEVVERPASVVKELVENSLDAGATVITVDVTEGGLKSISVVDNGTGMDKEDARLAMLRYATSKIRSFEDLSAITTMGFRGEALPSISAVSKLKLKTKTSGKNPGFFIENHGGNIVSSGETGAQQGTSIIVEDLFYNTPARRKHLKNRTTEGSLIGDYLSRLAISHPSVKITYKQNGREVFSSPGSGVLFETLAAIYGVRIIGELLHIDFKNEQMQIKGLIGKPSLKRSTRQQITLIINKRYIRSNAITQAVLHAYQGLLPTGRFPVAALHIALDTSLVDTNIHPAKMEIRLSNEKEVCFHVRQSLRKALQTSLIIPKEADKQNRFESVLPGTAAAATAYKQEELLLEPTPEYPGLVLFPSLQVIGQLHPTYILCRGEEGLYLIDQHAAHERVLYEKYLTGFSENLNSQLLLAPCPVHLSPAESHQVMEHTDFLYSLGFEIDYLGGNTIFLRGIPANFPAINIEAYLLDALDYLSATNIPEKRDLLLHLAARAACRSAVKSGTKMSLDEMQELIKKISSMENPYTCPHGRPTLALYPYKELTRRFLRT